MSETYVECLVKQKTPMSAKLLKWALIMATVVFGLLSFLSVISLIIAVVAGIAAYFVNRCFNLEFEYLYLDKEIAIDKIMNRSKRKKVEVLEVDRIEIIAPIKSHYLDSYRNRKMKTTDYSIGEGKQPDNRFVMYYNGDRRIILSPTPEFLKAIRTVAPRKVFAD